MSEKFEYGTGRRKTATARTRVYAGSGGITVNGRSFEEYFPRKTLQMIIRQPLVLAKLAEKLDAKRAAMRAQIAEKDARLQKELETL